MCAAAVPSECPVPGACETCPPLVQASDPPCVWREGSDAVLCEEVLDCSADEGVFSDSVSQAVSILVTDSSI